MLQINIEELTRQRFLPFGFVVDTPTIATAPFYSKALPANQGSARRHGAVTHLRTLYSEDKEKTAARPVFSLFVSSPRPLKRGLNDVDATGIYVDLLEKHPYTSQTFSPLGLAYDDEATAYLVIVAPPKYELGIEKGPDIAKLRAFIARGDQAVTYSAGVWHAPMIVIGQRSVPFLVIQYMNGVSSDDCQEVESKDAFAFLSGIPRRFLKSTKITSLL